MTAEPIRGAYVPLVVLAGQGLDLAIEAESVLSAQFAADWTGEPPIDVAALCGVQCKGDSNASRIVVVSTKSGARAFSSVRLTFRSVERSRILPLPRIVARGLGGRMVRGVVFTDADAATLVLDPNAFLDAPRRVLSDSLQGMGA